MTNVIIGCGYLGNYIAKNLIEDKEKVWGLKRNTSTLAQEIIPLKADLLNLNISNQIETFPSEVENIYYAVSADGFSEELYKSAYITSLENIIAYLEKHNVNYKQFIFVSSTGVYQHCAGEWVDENTEISPNTFSSRILYSAENICLKQTRNPLIVRLGGIYGKERIRMIKSVIEGKAKLQKNPSYTNRIHVEDCAGAIVHLKNMKARGYLYLGVDCLPASNNEVISWLCNTLDIKQAITSEENSTPKRGNKRCSNKKLLESGYKFKYPSYVEGYSEIIKQLELKNC